MSTKAPQIWLPPKIGHYSITPTMGAAPEEPRSSDARVRKILGSRGYDYLHREKETESTTAREAFIKALSTLGGDTLLKSTMVTHKEVTLKKMAKKHGVSNLQQLYEAAILEERNSRDYKNAAFLKSIEVYEGGDFDQQRVIIIAGPSGVGKSKVRSELVNIITQGLLDENNDPANIDKSTHHLMVSVDGGIEREVSQIRDLMNKTTLKLGYAGIDDLEPITTDATKGIKVKKLIEEAAYIAKLNLVIPTTHPSEDLKRYMKSDSTDVSFVSIEGNENTVLFTSQNRAFAKIGEEYPPLNEMKKVPESKKPGKFLSFDYGTYEAKTGEQEYVKKQLKKQQKGGKGPVVLHVQKDLMVVSVLQDETNEPTSLLITERQFQAWEKEAFPGTRKTEVKNWFKEKAKTNPELNTELITVVMNNITPVIVQEVKTAERQAPLIFHMPTPNTEVDENEKRIQQNREDALEILKERDKKVREKIQAQENALPMRKMGKPEEIRQTRDSLSIPSTSTTNSKNKL